MDPPISAWIDVARVASAVNVALLSALVVVWARNHRQFRSRQTFGVLTFASLLLAENAVALYYYVLDPTLSAWFATAVPPLAWRAILTLHVLEMVALLALVRVTLD